MFLTKQKIAILPTLIEICLLSGVFLYPFCEIKIAHSGVVTKSFWMWDTNFGLIIIGRMIFAMCLLAYLSAEKYQGNKFPNILNKINIINFIVLLSYIIVNFLAWKEAYNVSIKDGTIIDGGVGLICFGLAFLTELFRRHRFHNFKSK